MPNTPPETRRGASRRPKTPPSEQTAVTKAKKPVWRRWVHFEHPASWAAALLGGLAGALSYEPANLAFLIPLAPLGAFLAMRWAPTPGGAFRRVLAFGWAFYFGALFWLNSLIIYNPIVPLGIALLGLYIGFYPALGAWLIRRFIRTGHGGAQFAAFASVWLLIEWFRTQGRLAVPLVELGHAWALWPWAIQIASVLGELGVSLLVLWAAGLLFGWASLIARLKRPGDRPVKISHAAVLSVLTLLLATELTASALYCRHLTGLIDKAIANGPDLNVALVQPDVDQMFKLASYASPDAAQRADLSEQITALNENMLLRDGNPAWDLIVLPETAFTPFDFNSNEPLRQRVARMARRLDADMVFGASNDQSTPGHDEVYNAAYFIHRNGVYDPSVYNKMRLVPFGESLPYFDLIPGLQENIVGIGTFNEGKVFTLFTTGNQATGPMRFGTLICFESTFSQMARDFVKAGADFLVVITNDAWYGDSAGAAHHHHLSLLRAVETRRFVLRCANTGISSIISPDGRAMASLGLEKRGILQGAVPARIPGYAIKESIYNRFGNIWLLLPCGGLIGLVVATIRRRKTAPPPVNTGPER